MKKTISLLFCALLQPLLLSAQTLLPLVSPSETLNAKIQVDGTSVRIGLYEKGDQVVDVKTLQLNLDLSRQLAGNQPEKKRSQSNLETCLWRTLTYHRPL